MTVLVNGQDLDAFGDLESFEDSIQDIETVTIDNYTFEALLLFAQRDMGLLYLLEHL